MQRIVFDKGNESLEEIIEKITSQDTLEGKIGVYTMFKSTRCLQKGTIAAINLYLQIKYPDLWEEIKKVYYPTLADKFKKQFYIIKKRLFKMFLYFNSQKKNLEMGIFDRLFGKDKKECCSTKNQNTEESTMDTKSKSDVYIHEVNGKKWYLVYKEMMIKKIGKTQKLYFFVTESSYNDPSLTNIGCALPEDYEVVVSKKDGMPFLNKK